MPQFSSTEPDLPPSPLASPLASPLPPPLQPSSVFDCIQQLRAQAEVHIQRLDRYLDQELERYGTIFDQLRANV